MRRSFHRGFRRSFGRKHENIWLSAVLPMAAPAGLSQYSQVTNPFLNLGSSYSMVDPTLVRTHFDYGVISQLAGAGGVGDVEGAWGIIKLPVGSAGVVPSDVVPLPSTNANEDWIGHGYFTVPKVPGGYQTVAAGIGSSGSWADIRAKRKLGERDTIVVVFEFATAISRIGFGIRMLFNGARR
jgi:hypothetical protein